MLLFELTFRDWKKLSAFVKTCESIYNQSDTVMVKVKLKGLYIMLTDYESLCCVEARLLDTDSKLIRLNCPEYTVKIVLDSLINIFRKILKNKHSAVLFAEDENPYTLQVREIAGHTNKTVEVHKVETAEHRARVFHIMSTNEFKNRSDSYLQFRLPQHEFNKLITMQCIISGNYGGIGEVIVKPDVKRCHIQFYARNNGGMGGGVTVHTHDNAESAPLQHMPAHNLHIKYFLTYLKRAQNMFTSIVDYITIYVSDKGMLLQTDVKDGQCVVIFIADVSNEDLDSYA